MDTHRQNHSYQTTGLSRCSTRTFSLKREKKTMINRVTVLKPNKPTRWRRTATSSFLWSKEETAFLLTQLKELNSLKFDGMEKITVICLKS